MKKRKSPVDRKIVIQNCPWCNEPPVLVFHKSPKTGAAHLDGTMQFACGNFACHFQPSGGLWDTSPENALESWNRIK